MLKQSLDVRNGVSCGGHADLERMVLGVCLEDVHYSGDRDVVVGMSQLLAACWERGASNWLEPY